MIGSISRTLSTIRTKLNANSTVIWSGRGYHVIQVIDASYVNLKSQEVFTRGRINYLLSDYCVYLANKKAQELRRITGQRRKERQLSYPGFTRNENTGYIIQWIEKLLQIPIADGRKYSVWCILVPYLINCKHIPEEQCSDLIVNWLSRCDKLSRLRFNPNYTITYAIKRVGKYGPIYPDKIRQGFPRFYDLLVEFKII